MVSFVYFQHFVHTLPGQKKAHFTKQNKKQKTGRAFYWIITAVFNIFQLTASYLTQTISSFSFFIQECWKGRIIGFFQAKKTTKETDKTTKTG